MSLIEFLGTLLIVVFALFLMFIGLCFNWSGLSEPRKAERLTGLVIILVAIGILIKLFW